jgi:hypothetical protein
VTDETPTSGANPGPGAPRRRRWLFAALGAVALALATGLAASAIAARTSTTPAPPAIAVGVGDIVKVAGAPIGCAIRLQDAERALDCRRIGPLRGTYGSILTGHRLLVVRFLDQKSAVVVFSAHHGQARSRTCG